MKAPRSVGSGPLAPGEVERDRDAEDRVRDDGDEHRVERQLGGVHRVDVRELIPDRPEAVLEGVLEDQRERRDQQGDEVAEREEAEAVADEVSPHDASPAVR